MAHIAPKARERTAPGLQTLEAWLTPAEVAARLRVCRATVYKLCAKGELGHVRVGLSVRIAQSHVNAFLSKKREGTR
jgi:excisionase family DNA binding protein